MSDLQASRSDREDERQETTGREERRGTGFVTRLHTDRHTHSHMPHTCRQKQTAAGFLRLHPFRQEYQSSRWKSGRVSDDFREGIEGDGIFGGSLYAVSSEAAALDPRATRGCRRRLDLRLIVSAGVLPVSRLISGYWSLRLDRRRERPRTQGTQRTQRTYRGIEENRSLGKEEQEKKDLRTAITFLSPVHLSVCQKRRKR